MTSVFNNEGWINDDIIEKLEKEGRLEGDEALALIACDFSNATHNGYSPQQMLERVSFDGYKVTIEKI